jgi:hypothetical protein
MLIKTSWTMPTNHGSQNWATEKFNQKSDADCFLNQLRLDNETNCDAHKIFKLVQETKRQCNRQTVMPPTLNNRSVNHYKYSKPSTCHYTVNARPANRAPTPKHSAPAPIPFTSKMLHLKYQNKIHRRMSGPGLIITALAIFLVQLEASHWPQHKPAAAAPKLPLYTSLVTPPGQPSWKKNGNPARLLKTDTQTDACPPIQIHTGEIFKCPF